MTHGRPHSPRTGPADCFSVPQVLLGFRQTDPTKTLHQLVQFQLEKGHLRRPLREDPRRGRTGAQPGLAGGRSAWARPRTCRRPPARPPALLACVRVVCEPLIVALCRRVGQQLPPLALPPWPRGLGLGQRRVCVIRVAPWPPPSHPVLSSVPPGDPSLSAHPAGGPAGRRAPVSSLLLRVHVALCVSDPTCSQLVSEPAE